MNKTIYLTDDDVKALSKIRRKMQAENKNNGKFKKLSVSEVIRHAIWHTQTYWKG